MEEKKQPQKKERNKQIEEFISKLPEGRKIYYRFGNLMVEVSREEALELIKKEEEK